MCRTRVQQVLSPSPSPGFCVPSPNPSPEEQNVLTSQPRLLLQQARAKKVMKRFNIFLTRNVTVSSKQ